MIALFTRPAAPCNVQAQTLPVGSLHYYRMTYRYQRFVPLSKDFTLMLNGEGASETGFPGNRCRSTEFLRRRRRIGPAATTLPVWAPGMCLRMEPCRRSVLAAIANSLALRSCCSPARLGIRQVASSGRICRRRAGLGKTPRRWLDDWDVGPIRASTGISALWSSPMGPLKFSIAAPLNKGNC